MYHLWLFSSLLEIRKTVMCNGIRIAAFQGILRESASPLATYTFKSTLYNYWRVYIIVDTNRTSFKINWTVIQGTMNYEWLGEQWICRTGEGTKGPAEMRARNPDKRAKLVIQKSGFTCRVTSLELPESWLRLLASPSFPASHAETWSEQASKWEGTHEESLNWPGTVVHWAL